MKKITSGWLPTAMWMTVVLASAMLAPAVHAQSSGGSAPATLAIPRTPEGKPDFSGIHQWPTPLPGAERGRGSATIFDRKNFAPLKPGGEAFLEPRTGDPRHDEPRDYCMPAGFPDAMLSGNAMQFFQTKNYLTIVHEFQRMTRIVPLDGRPHREDLEPTFFGDPVGHWEGDTLVIETNGFRRWTLDDYYYTSTKEYRMHMCQVMFERGIRAASSRLAGNGPAYGYHQI